MTYLMYDNSVSVQGNTMSVNLKDTVTYKGVTGVVDFIDKEYFTITVNYADHRLYDTRMIVYWDSSYTVHQTTH